MPLGWILTENLRPMLSLLGRLVGYVFDDGDWAAVETGMAGTDSEVGPWFDYPVGPVLVHLALEPGAPELVTLTADDVPPEIVERLEWTAGIMQSYQVSERR